MTSTPLRPPPVRPAPAAPAPDPNPLRFAVPAATWALVAGLVAVGLPVLLVWAADSRGAASALDATRAAAQVWLVAHGTPVELPGGRLGLVPLGLLALPVALLWRAGAHAARGWAAACRQPPDARAGLRLLAALAGPYSLAATVVAGVAATGGAGADPLAAMLCSATVAGLAAGAAVARALGLSARDLVPGALLRAAAPAAAAVAALLGAGAVVAGAALALSAVQAADLARAGAPGAVGGLGLLLLGLALVPVAAVWAAAWLAGPGFAVGTGTAVSPFVHDLGPVPAVPLLAALPSGALPPPVAGLVLAVPLLAGALAGVLLLRRGARLRDAGATGALAGLVLGLLALAANGPAGADRLVHVGPSAWRVGLAVAVEVGIGAVVVAGTARWWQRPVPGAD